MDVGAEAESATISLVTPTPSCTELVVYGTMDARVALHVCPALPRQPIADDKAMSVVLYRG
jgi:hypothetical protein